MPAAGAYPAWQPVPGRAAICRRGGCPHDAVQGEDWCELHLARVQAGQRKAARIREAQGIGKPGLRGPRVIERNQHGTRLEYVRGCRCDTCTKANTNYHRRRRGAA